MRYLFVLLFVAGCAIEPDEQVVDSSSGQEAIQQRLIAQCRAYGFTEGTPEFSQCLMQIDMARKQRDSQVDQLLMQELIQQERRPLPSCASFPPGLAGYKKAAGECR